MEVVNTDACCESTVVWVLRRKGGGRLSSKLVEFAGGDAIVQTFDGQLGHVTWVDPNWVESVGQGTKLVVDGIETHILSLSFSVYYLHGHIFSSISKLCDCAVSSYHRVRLKSLRQLRSVVGRFRVMNCP